MPCEAQLCAYLMSEPCLTEDARMLTGCVGRSASHCHTRPHVRLLRPATALLSTRSSLRCSSHAPLDQQCAQEIPHLRSRRCRSVLGARVRLSSTKAPKNTPTFSHTTAPALFSEDHSHSLRNWPQMPKCRLWNHRALTTSQRACAAPDLLPCTLVLGYSRQA